MGCDEEHIRESARTFWKRLKEHFRTHFLIYANANATGHYTSMDNFSILERELYSLARTIKEEIYIQGNSQTLNINSGKYQLSHIWDDLLLNTLGINSNRPYNTTKGLTDPGSDCKLGRSTYCVA